MLQLIYQGQWALFLLITIALAISHTFHELGHAASAKLFGDDTAQKYLYYNARYGSYLFLGLIALSLLGLPVFSYLRQVGEAILPLIVFV